MQAALQLAAIILMVLSFLLACCYAWMRDELNFKEKNVLVWVMIGLSTAAVIAAALGKT